jgi:hypothetical protein
MASAVFYSPANWETFNKSRLLSVKNRIAAGYFAVYCYKNALEQPGFQLAFINISSLA